MSIRVRAARPEEAERLSEIACLAKAHWGYSAEQINDWREAFLTVTADYIAAHSVWVAADASDRAVAFAALERAAAGDALEHLWVLPAYMNLGIGRRLFQQVASESPAFAFTSDPQADGFYHRMGARKIGHAQSEHQGIALTKFRYP